MKKIISVEIGHMYADEKIGLEQLKSIDIFNNLKKEINEEYKIKILIDDLHIKENNFIQNNYLSIFNNSGITIDIIDYEKNFVNYAKDLLNILPSKNLKLESFRKENKKVLFFNTNNQKIPIKIIYNDSQKYTCIALSLSWQLCRIGIFKKWNNYDGAQKLINILPNKYKKIEDMVLLLHKEIHNIEVENLFF